MNTMQFLIRLTWLGAAMCLVLCANTVHAQYRVYAWESFEEGRLPQSLFMGHFANEQTVRVLDYRHPNLPRAMRRGISPVETGQFGVIFRPIPDRNHLSIVSPVSLDRNRIGREGRALYQADFYLPPEGEYMPTTALLAQVVQDGSTTYRFYRFGILEGGTQVFFSFTNNTPEPVLYLSQPTSQLPLRRPGWHRFQIIFKGQNEVYCAIDGKPTSFSPINEPTLRRLNAGIMVTTAEPRRQPVMVADNLSIQWTAQDVPIPESPWLMEMPDANRPNRSFLDAGNTVFWMNDPRQSWQRARSQRRPILTLFYTPNAGPYRYLRRITPMDDETEALLNRFVLLKVDVNQLGGGSLAQRYQIVRLPTLVVIGSDGREKSRLPIAADNTQWSEVRAFLEEAFEDFDEDEVTEEVASGGD